MKHRLFSLRIFALTVIGLIGAWLLFAWLAIPRIVQSQAEGYIVKKTGHHLSMDRPEFNPFELSLRLSGLHLTEPDGKPLLAFRGMLIDLSAASLRGTPVFDRIQLDGLEANVSLLENGKLNWSALLDALKSPEPKSESALPRFDIRRLSIAGSRLDFSDHRLKPAYVSRIEPINLVFTDLSSLPGAAGQYELSARDMSGARLHWTGKADIDALTATGNLDLDQVNLAHLSVYLKGSLPLAHIAGIAGMSADYRMVYASGKLNLDIDRIKARLQRVELQQAGGPLVAMADIEAGGGHYDLLKNSFELDTLSMTGGCIALPSGATEGHRALKLDKFVARQLHVDLAAHHAKLSSVALKDGHLELVRDAGGHIDLLDAFKTTPAKPEADVKQAGARWHYRLGKLELTGFDVAFTDQTVAPAAQLALQDIALGLDGISDDLGKAVPLTASFSVDGGGSFDATGNIVPGVPSADIDFKLNDLAIKPAQPYLSGFARLKIADGRLSTQGHASYGPQGVAFVGGFAVRDLRLDEADTGDLFMAWKFLGGAAVDLSPSKLNIDELVLDGLDGKLIINKDKSLSFKRILTHPAPALQPAQPASSGFIVNIDRLRFDRGEMDFADYSLSLPFGTRILDLNGVISGLSNRRGALGQIELDGQVDDYGLARAVGQVNLRDPADFMDLKVIFRNIEMSRLTPYTATFAGRRINSGKLSLDLEYKIKQRKLEGENKIVMDQLTLGDRVESPQARDLPLDLAVSILQDADGRIDLGLPMSGSLDDPKFSFGELVWKAFSNVISRIASAPFRALGALFGSSEKFESIAFDFGSAHLTPPEHEKLVHLAEALAKRPALYLSVHGVYADADRKALQDIELRLAVAHASGQHVEEGEDPGPIATHQPKVRAALEKMFAERFGNGELAALKEGFRRANPGKLEESVAGRALSGLKGLFYQKRTLSDQEVAALKDVDFYAVLFERLRNAVVIDQKQLQDLAAMRGEVTAAALKDAGAPAERINVLAVEKATVTGSDVPVKLVLGTQAVTP